MAMTTDSRNMYIPSSLSQQKRRYTQDSLYELYDDYFNMEDEVTQFEPSPVQQGHLHPHYLPSSQSTPFFFVLSTSSPISPGSGSGFTPISPLPAEDIPDALHQIIPQPSNSLFKVIDVIQHHPIATVDVDNSFIPSSERGRSQVKVIDTPTPSTQPRSVSRSLPRPLHPSRSSSRVRPTPPQLEIRDTITPINVSQSYHEALDPPNSSTVEIGLSIFTPSRKPAFSNPENSNSIPSNYSTPTVTPSNPITKVPQQLQTWRRPLPSKPHDPQTRVTYPSTNSQPSSTTHSRSRITNPQSLVETSAVNRDPVITQGSTVGHIRGRSSPFPTGGPVPIQLYFAPPSIPGSAKTSYSYF